MSYWLDFIVLGAVIGFLAFGRNWFDTTASGEASWRRRMNRNAKKGGCQ